MEVEAAAEISDKARKPEPVPRFAEHYERQTLHDLPVDRSSQAGAVGPFEQLEAN